MRMSFRKSLVTCLLLSLLLSLHLDTSEGHITFFSPREMMLMKEREGKKDMEPRSEDGQFQEVNLQQPEIEHGATPEKAVEVTVRLSPRQLDHMGPVLEEFIHEIVEERQKAK
ncbi:motilin-like [Periophthalmus magnuspinnatus]|uniref:motilin-like n=1 Tax=Periophthalmus magnuspinnatus TaxID=409849 RepID=UPI00145BB514|nr:motilin-like [Periophthalmus magnuspinnatus]